MLENFKTINNPLTVIAIFSGIAEISMAFALQYVRADLQSTFIWFVMGFPVLLILLFFITLNFNHKVLYAPSDYKDEQIFAQTLGLNQLTFNLEAVENQLESAPAMILNELATKIEITNDSKLKELSEIVNSGIKQIQQNVTEVKSQAEHIKPIQHNSGIDNRQSTILKKAILEVLRDRGDSTTVELGEILKTDALLVRMELNELVAMGVVSREKSNVGTSLYRSIGY